MPRRRLLPVLFAVAACLVLPGAASAASTTLVINEIDYDQPSTDTAEFIELKNVSGAAIDLDPYTLRLVNGANNAVYLTFEFTSFSVPAGGYVVLCGNPAAVAECD